MYIDVFDVSNMMSSIKNARIDKKKKKTISENAYGLHNNTIRV